MLLLHIWMPIIFYGPVKYNLSRGTKMSRYFHCPIYHSLSLPYISLSFTAQYFISVFCTPLLIGPYFISPCILCQFSRQKIKSIYPISITIIIGSTLPWLTLHGTLGNFIAHDNGTSPQKRAYSGTPAVKRGRLSILCWHDDVTHRCYGCELCFHFFSVSERPFVRSNR